MARKTINTGNILSSGPIAAQNWMHKLYAGIRALPKQRPDAQRSFNVEPPTATIDPETVETSKRRSDQVGRPANVSRKAFTNEETPS